jgi:hypothetical protein
MEKKVVKLEDLKDGMYLKSLKRVYYVNRDSIEEGVMLWEELVDCVSCLIEIDYLYKVSIEDGEVFLIDLYGEYNEGFYNVEEMLKKGVFEII